MIFTWRLARCLYRQVETICKYVIQARAVLYSFRCINFLRAGIPDLVAAHFPQGTTPQFPYHTSFVFLPYLNHTSGKRMHTSKQCVFPALRGNQHRVLSRNCSQPMDKQGDRSESPTGMLLAPAACSGEQTSAVFLRPPAVMGFATLHFMQRTTKGWRAQTKLIKTQKMKKRTRKSSSAESCLDQVMTQEIQPTMDNGKSLAPGRYFIQKF